MEKRPNNIWVNAFFTKIIYSCNTISINGLYIMINLKLSHVNHIIPSSPLQQPQNIKCMATILATSENFGLLEELYQIEQTILKNYTDIFRVNKKHIFMIRNSFNNNTFRVYEKVDKYTCNFIYRISGIWETANEIGLTYKVEAVPHTPL